MSFPGVTYKIVVTKLESEVIESEIVSALNKSLPAVFADRTSTRTLTHSAQTSTTS